jgi:hypothetical protein
MERAVCVADGHDGISSLNATGLALPMDHRNPDV